MNSTAAFENTAGDRSAAFWGLALVAAPALFLVSQVMKHELGVHLRLFDLVGGCFEYFDRLPLAGAWFSPVVFVLLPLAGVLLNTRAMLRGAWSREQRMLTLTARIRVPNVLSLAAAGAVLGGVILYQLAEIFLGRG